MDTDKLAREIARAVLSQLAAYGLLPRCPEGTTDLIEGVVLSDLLQHEQARAAKVSAMLENLVVEIEGVSIDERELVRILREALRLMRGEHHAA